MKKKSTNSTAYNKLLSLSKKAHTLKSITQLLEWDHETYMPKDGYIFRSHQLELLSSLHHREKTSVTFQKTLSSLIDIDTGKFLVKNLSAVEKKNLLLFRRDFLKEKKLPSRYVERFTKITSQAKNVWGEAKKKNNFALFAPYLQEIIDLTQERISYLGYKKHPYDALLDEFDPDRKTSEVETLFGELGTFIPSLLKKIPPVSNELLLGEFEERQQLAFSQHILDKIGYDSKRGRLDTSNHPFSISLHPTDSRITTRLHSDNLLECISSVLHEVGHSFYEMGLPLEHVGTPLGEYISLTVHESQSRFWQTFIGQSLPFWNYFYPLLQKSFPKPFAKVPLKSFFAAMNRAAPSLIRVEADEVTYSLHIIIRFELEKELITSQLKVQDLPEAWNSKMKKYLGIVPKNNSTGCLQDIHWAMGSFGYFPTYALGNLYAATLFECFKITFPDWEKKISHGDFGFILQWLRENIHQQGRLYTGDELLLKMTGQPLSTKPYCNYLKNKYK